MSKQPKEPDLYGRDNDDEAGEVPGGTYVPPDQPMGSTSWGITRSEERKGEPLEERAKHTEPEDLQEVDATTVGRLSQVGDDFATEDDDAELYGEAKDGDDLSAEESAVHFTDNP